MMAPRIVRVLLGAAALAALAGCSQNPIACTDEFRYFTTVLRTAAGAPVTGAQLSLRFRRNGSVLDLTGAQSGVPLAPGSYIVFSDAYLGRVQAGGDSVTLLITAAPADTTVPGFIDGDACHVQTVTLPDTIVFPAAPD